ncbi:DinB family protein [Nocardioides sp. zg-1228]|uniref:DinB family protein n=1 Tax=Nocardioides sp. zg-1228 TaxID=2763008 RepID=UPI001642CD9A|nr:DinB family protein [Nocardioides sp. zg-1228]MBC2935033.1 DinB family protein [Nocardioides sp. zg-1228]QSF56203.1 DinB family protein [Nocardioides sp. zg-1228]
MTIERTDPPLAADEADMLVAYLDYHRDTLRMKVDGLTADQLRRTHPPSTLTLGGLLKHVALNEAHWFGFVLHGRPLGQPWDSADWDADPDWELRSARDDSPEELRRLMDDAVAQARRDIDDALRLGGLGQPAVTPSRREGGQFTLRWIMLHMLEEYARHNGHADLIRESIDGATGE